MNKKGSILLASIFVLSVFLGCSAKTSRQPIPSEKEIVPLEPVVGQKASWQAQWERTISAARKEGRFNIFTTTEATKIVIEVFKKDYFSKYGIDSEIISGGGGELAAKLIAEQRAGIFTTDLYLGGGNTQVARLKPAGIYSPLSEALILPEVKNPDAWLDNSLPFIDKDAIIFSLARYPSQIILINSDMAKPEELQSYQDLLQPKWKGKIMMRDPTKTGGSLKWFSAMVEESFGPILGMAYMRELAKQELVIMANERLAAEWLVRGKYPIALNIGMDIILEGFKKEGIRVPVDQHTPREGGYSTTGGNNLTLLTKAPHPNATRVFLNWLLSREGQIEWSKASGKHSTRVDIPSPEEINPRILARQTGIKYVFMDSEELLLKTDEYIKLSQQVFGHLVR